MSNFISRLKDLSTKFKAGASKEPETTPGSDREQGKDLSAKLNREASTEQVATSDTGAVSTPDAGNQQQHLQASEKPWAKPDTETVATLDQENQQDRQGKPQSTPQPWERSLDIVKGLSTQLKIPAAVIKPFTGEKPLQRRPLFWLGLGVGGGAIAFWWGWWSLDRSLPNPTDALTYVRHGTLTIKASDGSILQQVGDATHENLKIDQIPQPVIQAFIASEDRRFYQHQGVDYQGILRAVGSNLQARGVVEGGSTLTQQLARIVFLNQKRSFWRKIKEARLAQKIEEKLNKQQILERYLNLVYLGSGAYGVADASWVYFSKPIDQLSLPEVATIVGLTPAPSQYSPFVNQQASLQRRNLVLQRMQEAGFITAAQAKEAIATPLSTNRSAPKRLNRQAPYFTDYIQQQLPKYISPDVLEAGGLTVETTLKPEWQKAAEETIKKTIDEDSRGYHFEQAALVAIDPRDGQIKAMVGGKDFYKNQFNRVTQAQRQPGSTFKGFVYAGAIAAGFTPYRGYLDNPYTVDGYKPKNFSEKHRGWLSMYDALISSINVVAVKVLIDVGWQPVIDLAHKMGIESELKPYYSLALGGSAVNLLELTSAYGTFATNGLHTNVHGIRRVIDQRGNVIYKANFQSERALQPDTAAIMTWMLRGVVNEGTGRAAQLDDRPVAGKTGTSDEARDLWFIGYIPQMVTGVWLGNDNNEPTWGASSIAAYNWHRFMAKVVKGMPVEKFPPRPELEGRKAEIKAQPVKPKYVIEGKIESEESKKDKSGDDQPKRSRYRGSGDGEDSSNDYRSRRRWSRDDSQSQDDSRPRYRRRQRRGNSDE